MRCVDLRYEKKTDHMQRNKSALFFVYELVGAMSTLRAKVWAAPATPAAGIMLLYIQLNRSKIKLEICRWVARVRNKTSCLLENSFGCISDIILPEGSQCMEAPAKHHGHHEERKNSTIIS